MRAKRRVWDVYFRVIQRMFACRSGVRFRQLQRLAMRLAECMARHDGLDLFAERS